MHFQAYIVTLALATAATLSNASPIKVTRDDGANSTTWVQTKCADLSNGLTLDDPSLVWEDCDALEARLTKRITICDRSNGNCGGQCIAHSSQSIAINGKGTWWTRWCHAGGLHTKNKGSTAFVSVGHSTSVEWSGSVSLAGDVTKFLNAQVGFDITHTKSVSQSAGCVNQDGKAHGVWFQEQMGWADTTVTTTVSQNGPGW